jgi:hypothetical protein
VIGGRFKPLPLLLLGCCLSATPAAQAAAIAQIRFLYQELRDRNILGRLIVLRSLQGRRVLCLFATLALAFAAAPAWAAVQITFYTKELGASFPHTFVILDGTLDRTGERIAEDYGFSAKTISPAILWGRVGGKVISDHEASYVKSSDQHFTVTLSDGEYDRVMAAVERWRTARQPSYSLDTANCVHFVAELAAAIGMEAGPRKGLMRKPRSFVEAITAANRDWLQARGAVIHRLKEPERKQGERERKREAA